MFVKICGITTEEDALGALAMGADAIGFVFAPSPRQIDKVTAGDICRRLPTGTVSVGVFVNQSKETVVRTANSVGLKAAQLHGEETPEEVEWIKDRVSTVIKSFVGGSPLLRKAWDWKCDAILLDSPNPGSGEVFDWSTADDAPPGIKLILAGGLTAQNVGEAIDKVRPWGVDVSSGVERSQGRKDLHMIKEFVSAARQAKMPDNLHLNQNRPYNWEADRSA